jgi:hypothetical protein
VADTVSFTLAGSDAELRKGGDHVLGAETASFSLTGSAAGLVAQRTMTASGGSITLLGNAATLEYWHGLLAECGGFVLDGVAAGLVPETRISWVELRPAAVAQQGGWLPQRQAPLRSREYEDYLQALREGREYTLPDETPSEPPKARRKGKRREPQLAAFPAYTGQWLSDLAAQPGVSAALDLAAYRDYRTAYEAAARAFLAAELARLEAEQVAYQIAVEAERRRRDEEEVLVLLLAA